MSDAHGAPPGQQPPAGADDPPGDYLDDPARRPLPLGPALTAGLLLAVPVVVLLIVPLYARTAPPLLGFPFFYWFQLVWVVAAAVFTFSAYVVVQRARRGARRPGGSR